MRISIGACVLILVGFAYSKSIDQTASTRVDHPIATTETAVTTTEKSRYEKGLEDYEEAQARQSRGMTSYDDYSDHLDHDHDHPKEEQKAVKEDPWTGYYDFIINEGSFKFWAAFQLVTAALLLYSAFAAVYYAKFNVITSDYDYYDDFFGRSSSDGRSSAAGSYWAGLTPQSFQRIFDALSSKKYS